MKEIFFNKNKTITPVQISNYKQIKPQTNKPSQTRKLVRVYNLEGRKRIFFKKKKRKKEKRKRKRGAFTNGETKTPT
jgi:hypothetical protein